MVSNAVKTVKETDFVNCDKPHIADVTVPSETLERGYFISEIQTALETEGVNFNAQYGHSDDRVRFSFSTEQDRAVLSAIINRDDFDYRLMKRQEGVTIPYVPFNAEVNCKGPSIIAPELEVKVPEHGRAGQSGIAGAGIVSVPAAL